MSEIDRCDLCQEPMTYGTSDLWAHEEVVVEIFNTVLRSVLANTSRGELSICENCYKDALPSYFTPADLHEIHLQFGLDYRDRGDFENSIRSFGFARDLFESAELLVALANSQHRLGHFAVAKNLYERALQLDPTNSIAYENLRILRDQID